MCTNNELQQTVLELKNEVHKQGKIQAEATENNTQAIKTLAEDVQPVIDWFGHINWFKSATMWFLGLIGAIGVAIITIKGVF